MPNNYFQFKQFTVYQDACAMKVCTDACLFGSLIPRLPKKPLRVLDIGTGTGLLALMCAQQNQSAVIDAVEIDGQAALQAGQNFAASPWDSRLTVWHSPIQDFTPGLRYDMIISNPPFFENDLKSDDSKRNLALHSAALGLTDLLHYVANLLDDDGIFGVLLPYHRTQHFVDLGLNKGLHLCQRVLVKQTPNHNYFRSILFFSKTKSVIFDKEIVIQNAEKKYTDSFIALLKDFYLYF